MLRREKSKIAIIHPQLIEGGGSEAGPLWITEALKDDYDVHLISMGRVNLGRLNEYYGTNLNATEIKTFEIPIPCLSKNRFDALRGYRLSRFCKKVSSEFDLMISTYNVMDFGRRGIQFIADFSFDDGLRRTFDPASKGLKGLLYKQSPFRWMYLKLGKILAGTSQDGWKKNLTIANSDWSGKVMEEVYGIETRTIYPPVVGEFPDIPWDRREDGFVCIGRLVPEKRVDRIIEILQKVRRRGWDIHLHIIGKTGDSGYIRNLQELCKRNSDWVFMEGGMFGEEKSEFISQHKFGIHGRKNEAFGIAVAEMVKAGCLVWVPNGGGQVEIVNHPALIYNNVEDAVDKIEEVLKRNTMQIELGEHLAKRSKNFSAEKFKAEIRKLIQEFPKERH